VAARLLGCDANDVRFHSHAAHAGSAQDAPSVPWEKVAKQAWLDRVGLSVTGFYMTPEIKYDFQTLQGQAFYYFCYGAAVTEVEIDTRTGEWWPKAVGVMDVVVDRRGNVLRVEWRRAPKHAPDVIREIERTVLAAAPYPAPIHLGQATYTDTWLWDKSGRFQLDTLTEGQR
jgi:hypothetical protein